MNKTVKLRDYTQPSGVQRLDAIFNGFKVYQVFKGALGLGLFDWLASYGPSTREEIVAGTGMNGMYSRSFLSILVEEGLLNSQGEKYSNAELAKNFLLNQKITYQGDLLSLDTRWNAFPELVKGKQALEDVDVPAELLFKANHQGLLRGELQGVVQAISNWAGFGKARTLLDGGGNNGLITIALCQLNPELRGVVLAEPKMLVLTETLVAEYGLAGRIQVQQQDVADELGGGYDLIILSHQLYRLRRELAPTFEKLYSYMNKAGLLVANHWFCGPGCSMVEGIKEMDKSLQSFGHPLCHVENFAGYLEQVGFSVIQASEVPSVYGVSKLFLAVKQGCCSPAKAKVDNKCC